MWIDRCGTEVLGRAECLRLLATAAREHRHGHLAGDASGGPLIAPVTFGLTGVDAVVRAPEELADLVTGRIVAFLVDDLPGGPDDHGWSVVVRGPALAAPTTGGPLRSAPGERLLHIRSDLLSGRRRALLPHHLRPALEEVPQ